MPQQGSRIQVHGTLVRVRVGTQISLRRFLSYRLESQALTVSLFESILRFYLQSFNIRTPEEPRTGQSDDSPAVGDSKSALRPGDRKLPFANVGLGRERRNQF